MNIEHYNRSLNELAQSWSNQIIANDNVDAVYDDDKLKFDHTFKQQ